LRIPSARRARKSSPATSGRPAQASTMHASTAGGAASSPRARRPDRRLSSTGPRRRPSGPWPRGFSSTQPTP
jgi:hypothetical protein